MKVCELIVKLKEMPQNSDVMLTGEASNDYYDATETKSEDVRFEVEKNVPGIKKAVLIL